MYNRLTNLLVVKWDIICCIMLNASSIIICCIMCNASSIIVCCIMFNASSIIVCCIMCNASSIIVCCMMCILHCIYSELLYDESISCLAGIHVFLILVREFVSISSFRPRFHACFRYYNLYFSSVSYLNVTGIFHHWLLYVAFCILRELLYVILRIRELLYVVPCILIVHF